MKKIVLIVMVMGWATNFAFVAERSNNITMVESDSINWVKHIKSGKSFKAVLTSGVGTLDQDQVYTVQYTDRKFETTGYNLAYESVITAVYDNANPRKKEISLWGAVFQFDEKGNLSYKGKSIGKMFL